MTYERQILRLLSDIGDKGSSVQLLSKHLYNLNATLFSTVDIAEIRNFVRQYLTKNSKSPSSLLERTGQRGYYRLNTRNSADARQLVLEFTSEDTAETDKSEPSSLPDQSLSLFD